MANSAPIFLDAAAGAIDIAGAWSYTCQAPQQANNLIIVQLLQDGTTAGAVTVTGATNITSITGGANAWTALKTEQAVGSASAALQSVYAGRSTGTSAPTISGGNSTSEDVATRSYQFWNVNTGATVNSIIENSTAGTATNGAGTSTSVADTAVVTTSTNRLACNFIAVGSANRASELTAMSGASGGTWAYAVAAYGTAAGLGATLALTTATLASSGTIDGATDAITSSAWGVIGFALIPGTLQMNLEAGHGVESG